MWLYSKKTGGLYNHDFHGGSIPKDAKEVSDEERAALISGVILADIELTPDQAQVKTNANAREYLASTDWYVIRMQETGEPIPREVVAERAKRRAEVIE